MELVDKFNNKRYYLNKSSDRYEKTEGEYMQSVHTWILNSNGEFLIQKRSHNKRNYPDMWSQTGGAVDSGELPIDAALRECREELGIDFLKENTELLLSFKRTYDFIDVFLIKVDFDISDLTLQKEEVQDAKWIQPDKLREMINDNLVTPSIGLYFDMMLKLIKYDK